MHMPARKSSMQPPFFIELSPEKPNVKQFYKVFGVWLENMFFGANYGILFINPQQLH